MVEHGGDAVEAEAVEVVLGHPELQVGQQEVQNAGLAVVEALGAPGGMLALVAIVEELPGGAVEHIDALGGVLDGVGMDNIQQDLDAHLVSLVDQVLQILGLAEPGGSGIEVGDLVAEGAIVGMLHDSHELDGVVAGLLHMGQGDVSEFPVGANLALFLGHADMGLVDVQALVGLEALVGPLELVGGINDLADEGVILLVLNGTAAVQGQMLGAGHVGVHDGLDLAAVPQGVLALQVQLPVSVIQLGHGVAGLVPIVELALQVQLISGGGPLTVDPAGLGAVEAVVVICICEIIQGLAFGKQTALGGAIQEHAQVNVACEGCELRVQF